MPARIVPISMFRPLVTNPTSFARVDVAPNASGKFSRRRDPKGQRRQPLTGTRESSFTSIDVSRPGKYCQVTPDERRFPDWKLVYRFTKTFPYRSVYRYTESWRVNPGVPS